jgi:hypothetical protein
VVRSTAGTVGVTRSHPHHRVRASAALLLAALYFAVTASAEFEFKSDLLSKLEAHLIVAVAMYGAVVAWGRRQGK